MDPKNKATIDNALEDQLYFIINEAGGFIWRMNHDMRRGDFTDVECVSIKKDIETMRENQLYAIEHLPKYGVQNPFRNEQKHPSAEYWAWFRWWDEFFKAMPEEEWKEYNKVENPTARPAGNWRDRIPQEEESIKKSEEFLERLKGNNTGQKE